MAGSHCVPPGIGSGAFRAPARAPRNTLGNEHTEADRGRYRGFERVWAPTGASHGVVAEKITARFAACEHGRPFARRGGRGPATSSRYCEISPAFCTEATRGETAMRCEENVQHLIDAAAQGEAPETSVAEHIQHCQQCQARFQREEKLFAAIDDALHARLSESPPSGFLARASARLAKEPANNSGVNPAWAAAAVLVLALLALTRPWITSQPTIVAVTPVAPAARVQQTTFGPNRHGTQTKGRSPLGREDLPATVPRSGAQLFANPRYWFRPMSRKPLRNSWRAWTDKMRWRQPLSGKRPIQQCPGIQRCHRCRQSISHN